MFVSEHHPAAQETVVLLHPGAASGWIWDEHLTALAGYHILVPDLPGFGRSNTVDYPSVHDVAADCADTIGARAHDGWAHVVGHSLGGVVGLWLLAQHQTSARSAVLTGVPARPSGRAARLGHAVLLALWHQRWFWELGYRFGPFPTGDRRRFIDTALGISSTSQRKVFDEDRRADLPSDLPDVHTDTLVLAGTKDTAAIRDGAADLCALMPNARAAYIPDAGHLWPVTHPELFDAVLLAWLQRHEVHPELL